MFDAKITRLWNAAWVKQLGELLPVLWEDADKPYSELPEHQLNNPAIREVRILFAEMRHKERQEAGKAFADRAGLSTEPWNWALLWDAIGAPLEAAEARAAKDAVAINCLTARLTAMAKEVEELKALVLEETPRSTLEFVSPQDRDRFFEQAWTFIVEGKPMTGVLVEERARIHAAWVKDGCPVGVFSYLSKISRGLKSLANGDIPF